MPKVVVRVMPKVVVDNTSHVMFDGEEVLQEPERFSAFITKMVNEYGNAPKSELEVHVQIKHVYDYEKYEEE